jgi:hypothetical protein
MKRVATAFLFGLSITALIFAAHLTVMNWFSWKDKPMMPNFFTDLLLPAYRPKRFASPRLSVSSWRWLSIAFCSASPSGYYCKSGIW